MSNERYNQIIDNAYNNYTQTKIIKTDSGETHIEITGVNPNVEITVSIYVTPTPIATTTTTGGGS